MIVTIDGPVASGKSTAAKNLAALLGFVHLDSGAIYRCLTVLATRRGVDGADREAVGRMLDGADVRLDAERVFLDGEDVTDEIRLPEVSNGVRPLAENPDVRRFVADMEREYARDKDVVAEGRDMGSVVFPYASVKIYLAAPDEERARRRYEELLVRGTRQDYETVLEDLKKRDRADMTRKIAPLIKPEDAIEVNSAGWSQEQTAARLREIVREATGGQT